MRHCKLSHQIMAVFVLVVCLAVGISGILIGTIAHNIILRNVNNDQLILAQHIAQEIEHQIEDARSIITVLSNSSALKSMNSEDVLGELLNYQAQFPILTSAYVARLTGEQITRTDGEPLENVATLSGFQLAANGMPLFSDANISEMKYAPTLTAYIPILEENSVLGVLVIDVSFTRFQTTLADLQLNRNETAVIFAEDGRVIAHSHLTDQDEIPILDDTATLNIFINEPANILDNYTDELGRTVTGAHVPVTGVGWGVVVQTPRSELTSEITLLFQPIILGLFGSIIFASMVGWLIAKRLSHPLNQLVQVIEKTTGGDLRVRSGLQHTSTEIGLLASAFDRLVESLALRQSEAAIAADTLREYANNLEATQEIDHAVLSAKSTQEIVSALSQQIKRLIPATHASITEFDPDESLNSQADSSDQAARPSGEGLNLPIIVGASETLEYKPTQTTTDTWVLDQIARIETSLSAQGLKSYIVFPLLVQGNYIGLLNVGTEEPGAFASEHVHIVSEIADLIALVIHDLRLTEHFQNQATDLQRKLGIATQEIRLRANEVAALYAVNRDLVTTIDLEELLPKIALQIKNAVQADRCAVFLFDKKPGKLVSKAATGYEADRLANFSYEVGEEVVGQAYAKKQLQYVPDLLERADLPVRDQIRALLVVPIRRPDRNPIGVLSVASLRAAAFTPEQQLLLETMSDQVAHAIDNAYLYRATEHHAENLSVLYVIGKEIVANRDFDLLLKTIAYAAVLLVNADKSLIVLIDTEQQSLSAVVGYNCEYKITYEGFHHSLNGWVFKTRKPSLSYNIQMDKRGHGLGEAGASDFRNGAAVIAPLMIGDKIIGTLGVINEKGNNRFTTTDLGLVTMLSGLAAIAIQNLQLYHASLEADHIKSAFLASMSHELRTPLNSIIGFTGIMLQGLVAPLTPELEKQLGMVYAAAKHLLALINDVLDISKIEAGQLTVNFEPVDMSAVIDQVIQSLTPMAQKKNLLITSAVDTTIEVIQSDPRRVEQILINLVNNAIKFTNRGEIHVECYVEDDSIVTHVKDTGIGIKLEDMEKLFTPFHQIDTGLTRRHEGTGLGLSICRRLLALLDGEIRVESEWGVGSIFTFTLPLKNGAINEAEGADNRRQ